jgi:hypothetical protein
MRLETTTPVSRTDRIVRAPLRVRGGAEINARRSRMLKASSLYIQTRVHKYLTYMALDRAPGTKRSTGQCSPLWTLISDGRNPGSGTDASKVGDLGWLWTGLPELTIVTSNSPSTTGQQHLSLLS